MPANWKKLYIFGPRASPAWGVFVAGVSIAMLAWGLADSRVQEHAIAKADAAINEAGEAIRALGAPIHVATSRELHGRALAAAGRTEEAIAELQQRRDARGADEPQRAPAGS
mgnify:CR=1 FL=1